MPLFEFQCAECDAAFEELVRSASVVAEVKCPQCGSYHIRRKVSTFASKVSGGGGSAVTSAASCAPGGA